VFCIGTPGTNQHARRNQHAQDATSLRETAAYTCSHVQLRPDGTTGRTGGALLVATLRAAVV